MQRKNAVVGERECIPVREFRRRFRRLILLSWLFPPGIGVSFLVFVDVFSVAQMQAIMAAPWVNLFALFSMAGAFWYLDRYMHPVYAALAGPGDSLLAMRRLFRFPILYWGLFILTLAIAPSTVMFTAQHVLDDYTPPLFDWFRIHLVALIVSIAIGLPLFFRLIDLFGEALTDIPLQQPHLTLKVKVFLIGALVPLLIDTILVQYFWARTGYFATETLMIWLLLELLAIGGSLLFVRSFGQSLAPLYDLMTISHKNASGGVEAVARRSTDELGVLTDEMRALLLQRDEIQRQISQSERELSSILNNMQDIYYRTDLQGMLVRVTPSVEPVLGFRPQEVIGKPLADSYVEPGGHDTFIAQLHASGGKITNYTTQIMHRDGSTLWISTSAQYYYNEAGELAGVEGVGRDITDLVLAQQALGKEREHALVTLNAIGDGVISLDTACRVTYINPVAKRLFSQQGDAILGHAFQDFLAHDNAVAALALDDIVRQCLHRGEMSELNNLVLKYADDEFILKVIASPLSSESGQLGVVIVLHDITEVMGITRQLNYQATHDLLTGLYNRSEFEKRLGKTVRSSRHVDSESVLFYMDLDQFKIVNDTGGHSAGDELLMQLGSLLQRQLRDDDILARLGGDEFGVLLHNCSLEVAMQTAERIRRAVKEFRFVWQKKSFEIGVSIGVAPIQSHHERIGDVLRAADAACYVAKELGRNRVHVYEEEDDNVARHHGQMEWVQRITQAFEESRFELYAQPIVPTVSIMNLDNETPRHEILMRIRENETLISPMAFIPAAERYNLMPTLDRWVVRTTLGLLRQAQGPHARPPIVCNINLSGQSLNDDGFLQFVLEQFEESGVHHSVICFEITETAAIANLTRAMEFISVLVEKGCTFALDDFGSGLSSFGYLKNLNVHYLKIDGSFIRDMNEDSADHAMVASINSIGHVLGLKTVAEFVENEETVFALSAMGVDYIQGYGVGMPVPLSSVLKQMTS